VTATPSVNPCSGDLSNAPVSIMANSLDTIDGPFAPVFPGQGIALADAGSCCNECYNRPGCFGFSFAPSRLSLSVCQVLINSNPGLRPHESHITNIASSNLPGLCRSRYHHPTSHPLTPARPKKPMSSSSIFLLTLIRISSTQAQGHTLRELV
jgi:hypothetical protein